MKTLKIDEWTIQFSPAEHFDANEPDVKWSMSFIEVLIRDHQTNGELPRYVQFAIPLKREVLNGQVFNTRDVSIECFFKTKTFNVYKIK